MTTPTIHPFEKAGHGKAPFRCVGLFEDRGPHKSYDPETGITTEIGAPGQPMGTCHYCGTGIAYCFQIESADGFHFIVGSDCVAKTNDVGLRRKVGELKADVQRTKREERKRAVHQARKITWRREAWTGMRQALHEIEDLNQLLKVDHRITRDLRTKLIRFGSLSEPQIALARKLQNDIENAPPKVDVPETDKRMTIRGKVVTIREQLTEFGPQVKMLVEVMTDDGAFRLWGSCPANIRGAAKRDDLVQFDAKITRSEKDPSFGFYSRPTKAQLDPEQGELV